MMMEAETKFPAYKAEGINNQNKALCVDTRYVEKCEDFSELRRLAEALIRQINNSSKGLDNIQRIEKPSERTADIIHKMTTNYRHQSALLYQIEKRMYEINPLFYTKYIKTKDKGFSYSAMFYDFAEKKLFGWLFSWIDKKTEENYSF